MTDIGRKAGRGRGLAVMVVLASLLLGSSPGAGAGGATAPSLLASHGWDARTLADLLLDLQAQGTPAHSILLAHDGELLLDAALFPYDGSTVHQFASVTKSITPTVVELAVEQGAVSWDDPIVSFFPERSIANLDERKARVTLRHLATMTGGFACDATGDERTLQAMKASADWVGFALDLPMAAEPGTRFAYCSPGMHLLSAALQAATGQTEEAYARERLFGPLGISDLVWQTDPQGVTRGWADLYLHPQDAARLGQLWLQGGRWDGRQLVSQAWMQQAVAVQADTGGGDDYGYGWWIPTSSLSGEFKAVGRGGQLVSVHPALGLVVVLTCGGCDIDRVMDRLAPAFVSPETPLPADPVADRALADAVALVREPPAPAPVPALPPAAAAVSGVTWDMDPNPKSIATVRLDFHPGDDEAAFEITFSDRQPARSGQVGLDGVLRIGPGREGLTDGARGWWSDEDTFTLEYDEIAHFEAFILRLTFQGERLVMEGRERSHEVGFTATGTRRGASGS